MGKGCQVWDGIVVNYALKPPFLDTWERDSWRRIVLWESALPEMVAGDKKDDGIFLTPFARPFLPNP